MEVQASDPSEALAETKSDQIEAEVTVSESAVEMYVEETAAWRSSVVVTSDAVVIGSSDEDVV